MIRETIKEELQKRGWNVKQLANETGIRYPTLTEYLGGKKEMTTPLLEKLFSSLNLTIQPDYMPKGLNYCFQVPLRIEGLDRETFIPVGFSCGDYIYQVSDRNLVAAIEFLTERGIKIASLYLNPSKPS